MLLMILSKVTKNAGLQSLSIKHTFGKSAGGGGGGGGRKRSNWHPSLLNVKHFPDNRPQFS